MAKNVFVMFCEHYYYYVEIVFTSERADIRKNTFL